MPTPHWKKLVLIVSVCIGLFLPLQHLTHADELDDITKQIKELTDSLNSSVAATKPLESELTKMQQQIAGIKIRVTGIEADVEEKKKEIAIGFEQLIEKEQLLHKTIRNYYINSHHNSPLFILFSAKNASEMTQALAYQQAKADQDKSLITNLALSITDLEAKREKLKQEQTRLIAIRTSLDQQSTKLDEVIKGAKAFQSSLSSKIADLSAKQQEILSARSGNFTFTIGSGELADEYLSSIKGFKEGAPSGHFGVFSFGGYTHRKGMSQYGARGRAQSGQDFKAILKAYYGKEPVGKDTGGSIKVAGHGEMDFEGKYLYGIAEMPSTWHPEALKAQAVAARTYALRYKQEGKEICTDEGCQVYNDGKANNPPDAWKQAVESTRGQVLEDVVTYYASTHGGYATPIGWDTTDGGGGGNFIDKSYDKIGGSPWLYKSWWRQGYSVTGNTCGRANPWLSPEEMADIINAARFRDDRVTPVTTSCWGGNPYSHEELRSKANGPATVTGVSVTQGNGNTSEIVFQTNIGEIKLSASEFKEAFNLRAPGYLRIPQTGFAFFNIEKK